MFRKILISGFLFTTFLMAACGTTPTDGAQDQDPNNQQDEQNDQDEQNNNGGEKQPSYNLEDLKLGIDSYVTGDHAAFTIELFNESDQEVEITFSSGQKYEIVVTNQEGTEIYRYSADKGFTQALETVSIPANDKLSWEEQWDLQKDGNRVPAGEYNVQITLKAYEVNGQSVEEDQFTKETQLIVGAANSAFRNIEVEKQEDGKYIVTGEARVFEGTFSYTVEDGHNILIEETPVRVDEGAPSWSEFSLEIVIPTDQLPVNGSLNLLLFERSAKDNSQVNVMPIHLDHIQQ